MKKLHCIPGVPAYPWSDYIQVTHKGAVTSNGSEFLIVPVAEVFGKDVLINKGETLYFSKFNWEHSRIWDASRVVRNGNLFTCYSKDLVLGTLLVVGMVGDSKGDFTAEGKKMTFPNVYAELVEKIEGYMPFVKLGVAPRSLENLNEAMRSRGVELVRYRIDKGDDPHYVNFYESDAIGGTMPIEEMQFELNAPQGDKKGYDASDIELNIGTEMREALNEIIKSPNFGLRALYVDGHRTLINSENEDSLIKFTELAKVSDEIGIGQATELLKVLNQFGIKGDENDLHNALYALQFMGSLDFDDLKKLLSIVKELDFDDVISTLSIL